jgi:hypothetical protein
LHLKQGRSITDVVLANLNAPHEEADHEAGVLEGSEVGVNFSPELFV